MFGQATEYFTGNIFIMRQVVSLTVSLVRLVLAVALVLVTWLVRSSGTAIRCPEAETGDTHLRAPDKARTNLYIKTTV